MSLQEPGRLPIIKMLRMYVGDNHAWWGIDDAIARMLKLNVLIKSEVEIKVRIVLTNEKVV